MNKTDQNPTLSSKQFGAIAALLESPSVDAAMRRAKVARTSYYAWIKEDAFRTELERRRREIYEDALRGLKSLSTAAVTELQRLLRSRNERVRLAAVKLAIDGGFSAHERLDIETRLGVLERHAMTNKGAVEDAHTETFG